MNDEAERAARILASLRAAWPSARRRYLARIEQRRLTPAGRAVRRALRAMVAADRRRVTWEKQDARRSFGQLEDLRASQVAAQ